MTNLTLSLDEDLLKKSRIYAIEHDTSVNALVRDYLRSLVERGAQRRTAIAELRALIDELAAIRAAAPAWQWNRDEIHDDRMGRGNEA